jgi:hypothetical protein
MTTNVPQPTFGPTGFIIPAQSAVLAGVQADQNVAFGGNLNPSLTTPQGQLATSETAIIGDVNNQFLALSNGVDPAFASGRMQDAIGRIYFLTRIPASSTVVTATCSGLNGTVIPIGAQAVDQAGNIYLSTQSGTITGGVVSLTFAAANTGPIACPIGFLNAIYRAIPGWDSINNPGAGVVGAAVETRANFEYRRQQSVAMNSQGALQSVLGAVFSVPGVLDAYVTENVLGVTSGATFTGSISGTVLTASSVTGTIAVGQTVTGAGMLQSTVILSQATGTPGGAGTYNLNNSQSIGAEAMVAALGGVQLNPNSIYVAVYGGTTAAIAQAIWSKKAPGCNYNGNTTATVTDPGPAATPYTSPLPSYQVTWQTPTPTPILFAISMQLNANVPSNATTLVQNAVIAAFNGADGGSRARIGAWIFASRYFAGIAALGSWATIYSILVGIGTANQNSVLMNINQVPTITAGNIAVTFT